MEGKEKFRWYLAKKYEDFLLRPKVLKNRKSAIVATFLWDFFWHFSKHRVGTSPTPIGSRNLWFHQRGNRLYKKSPPKMKVFTPEYSAYITNTSCLKIGLGERLKVLLGRARKSSRRERLLVPLPPPLEFVCCWKRGRGYKCIWRRYIPAVVHASLERGSSSRLLQRRKSSVKKPQIFPLLQ